MNWNPRLTLLLLLAVGATAAAYLMGLQQGERKIAATGRAPQTQSPGEIGHPQLPPSAEPGAVSPGTKFTHSRVGQRNVKAILADGDLMWVGTSGGVIRNDTKKDDYRLFDVKSGLLANGVFHVSKMDGRIVVGTYGGGMALYDPAADKWQVLNIPQGLADAFVYDVLKTTGGDVWIATWSGANRVRKGRLDDRSQWDLYTVENTGGGLPNNWVYGLAEGKDGAIWLATEGGLTRLKDGQWDHWQHKDGLGAPYELVKAQIPFAHDPAKFSQHHARQKAEMGLQGVDVAYNPNYIVALAVDRDGVVWCGTWGGGLSRFDGKRWKTYTVAEGLPANHVFMLRTDADGRLWIGTSNGLARFDGEAFRVYTTADGLFSNTVFSMASAADGSLWVGSFGGVARIEHLP